MPYMTTDEFGQSIQQANAIGVSKYDLLPMLQSRGYQIQGFDDPAPDVSINQPNGQTQQQPQGQDNSLWGYIKGIGSGISNDIQQAGENANNQATQPGGFMKNLLPTMGAIAGGAANAISEPIKPIVGSVMQGARMIPGVNDALQSISGGISQLQQAHPELARQVIGALQTASLPLAMQGAESAINTGSSAVGKLGESVVNAPGANIPTVEELQQGMATKDALANKQSLEDLTLPKENRGNIFEAAKKGNLLENSAGQPTGFAAGNTDMATIMKKAGVEPDMSQTQAVTQIGKYLKTSGKQVEADLAASNYDMGGNVDGILEQGKKEAIADTSLIPSSKAQVTTFNDVGNAIKTKFDSLVEKNDGNQLLSVYQTRKWMDSVAPAKVFGGDETLNARINAFRYYRDSFNHFLSDNMLSNGSKYAEQMDTMHKLYGVLDNLEETVPNKFVPTMGDKLKANAKTLGIGAAGAAATLAGAPIVKKIIGSVVP